MVLMTFRRLGAASFFSLLAFLCTSIPTDAQSLSFAGAQITVPTTGLKTPGGVAADLAGNVFIADTGNNRVVKFPVGGAPQVAVGSGLSAPQGVAVDSAGDVFIADTGNKRVVELPAGNGGQKSLATGLADPVGVAVDSNGDVFIADYGDGLVEIPSGGKAEVLNADFEAFINSVAVDGNGNIFLTNTLTFDSNPEILNYVLPAAIQEIPSGCANYTCITTDQYLPGALGITVDVSDNLYVVTGSTAVLEFTGGSLSATAVSGLAGAVGVAMDPRGNLFVADSSNADVVELQLAAVNFGNLTLGAAGSTLKLNYKVNSAEVVDFQNALTLGASNSDFTLASGSSCTGSLTANSTCVVNLTFTPTAPGMRRGAVQLANLNGTLATTMVYGTGLGPQVAFGPGVQTTLGSQLGLTGPDGIAVDGSGDILITDTFNNRVINLPPKGALTTIGVDLCEPAGVAVDGAGDVFIADYCNNRILEVPTGGAAQVSLGSGLNGPKDVAVDGQGDVIVADTLNNRVVEIVAGGAQITLNVSVGGVGLNSPTGVAVNAEGDILIADTGNNRVVEAQPNGVQTAIGSGFSQPTGVAVDGAGANSQSQPGDVYVADYGNHRVVEVPAGGSPQFTIGTGYTGPHGVAVDAAGDLFVADRDGDLAYEFLLSTPDSLSFPTSTPVNQRDNTDGPMAISVQDIGNDPLTIATVTYPKNFLNLGPEEGLGCGNGLQFKPGQSCYVTTELDPTSVGANSGSIVLTDNSLNATNATQSISASGTGLYDTQTISFSPSLTSYPYTAGSFPLSASASSTLAVSFASLSTTICTVSGSTAMIVSAGKCTIQASQGGNAIYSAATPVSATFTITAGAQSITFNPTTTTYSYAAKSFPLSATASSGLSVSFATTTPAVCKASGATAAILAGGICTIQATQPGNIDYAAATPVPVSFTITPVAQTISFAAITATEVANSTLKLSATATSKLPVKFTSETLKVCTVSGQEAKLLIEGTCKIVASQAGNSTYTAAPAVPRSFTVHLASQKISFPAIAAQKSGTSLSLKATASSGLKVEFASTTTSVCTVTGTTAKMAAAGTCTIKATQGGNDVYAAAPAVTESFKVTQ